MAYSPRKWSPNQAISHTNMNRLEEGVADAHEAADVAAEAASTATSIGEANGEDIAKILDELDELRQRVNTLEG